MFNDTSLSSIISAQDNVDGRSMNAQMRSGADGELQFNTPYNTRVGGLQGVQRSQTLERQQDSFETQAVVPKGMFDAYSKTCDRWHLQRYQRSVLLGYRDHEWYGQCLLSGYLPARTQDVRDRIGYVLAISLGLGTLFNEDARSELDWLTVEHKLLRTSPLEFMLRGHMINLIAVADIVRTERGL